MTRDLSIATEEEILQKHRDALMFLTREQQIERLHQWWIEGDKDWIVFELIKGWDQKTRLQVLQDF